MHDTSAFPMFGILELPFLFIAVYFAFLVAGRPRGGNVGRGMTFLAWGFLVMAIGHLHMQIQRYFGMNLFGTVLGAGLGDIAWIVALAVTWALSAYGFILIYRADERA
jgi:riboflavin transporter FmnP